MPKKYADDVTMTQKTKRQTNLIWNIFRDVTNDTTNKEPRGTMTRKTKRQTNLIWNIFRDVTNDTTNKGSRPEIPRHGTGERGELSDLLATCRSPRHH